MAKEQLHRFVRSRKERIAEAFGRKPVFSKRKMLGSLAGAEAALKALAESGNIRAAERERLGRQFGKLVGESGYSIPFDSRAFLLSELARSVRGIAGGSIPLSGAEKAVVKGKILRDLLARGQTESGKFFRIRCRQPGAAGKGMAGTEFAFHVDGAGDVAVFRLSEGRGTEFTIDSLREADGAIAGKAEAILGMPWFELLGRRLAWVQREIIRQGFLLRMPEGIHKTSPGFAKLFLHESTSRHALYFNPKSEHVRQTMGKYYILLPGAMPKVDLSRLPESVRSGRKPAEQRESDRYMTRERLEKRRGLKLKPEGDSGTTHWTDDRGYKEYSRRTGVDFEGLFRGKRVLDVGCGAGNFVAQARGKGIFAEGVDPNAPAGSEHLHKMNLHEFEPKYKYDCVVSVKAIPVVNETAYGQRQNIYLMLNFLKPGGMLVVNAFQGTFKGEPVRGSQGFSTTMLKKLQKLGFELDFPAKGQDRLIIRKKSEDQVEQLGRMLGVI
jgi:SAM-dependent methyltransferase